MKMPCVSPRLEVVLQSELDDARLVGQKDSGSVGAVDIEPYDRVGGPGTAQVSHVGEVEGFTEKLPCVSWRCLDYPLWRNSANQAGTRRFPGPQERSRLFPDPCPVAGKAVRFR